jgi:PAS domain S-box-containing protein/putative nucleotidyltransferase with HDIG domain
MNDKSLNALMIEDSEDDAQLIIHEIKKGGYNPVYERVETSVAMKKALKEKQWDIILCDYKMPNFSGPSAISLLKEANIDIPIIIVSGTIGEETAVECMRLGAHDYIMKSNWSRLYPAITRELEEKKNRDKQKQTESQKEAALESLRTSEELFTKLVNSIPDIIIHTDLEGNILFVNDKAMQIGGYSRQEMEGRKLHTFVAPEDQEKVKKNKQLLLENDAGPREYILIAKDGKKIPFDINGDVLRNEEGIPFGFVNVVRDISERKRIEKNLRERDERLRGITENLPGVIFQFYAKDNGESGIGYISEPLDEFAKIITNVDMANLDAVFPEFLSRIHEDDRERFITSIKTAVENVTRWNFEGRIFLQSGKMIWFQGMSTPTRLEDQIVFDGILLNINERRLAEEKWRKSEEKFHNIFMATPNCIAITRLNDGLLIEANKRFEDIVGWKRWKVIGKTSLEWSPSFWVDPSARELMVADLKAGKDIMNREFEFRRSDGSVRNGIYSARPINIDDEECLIFILQDITEQRWMDAELQRTLDSLKKAVGTTIQVLVSALESRDPYTAGHQLRVAHLACAIAEEMGIVKETVDGIRLAGSIHDIGKISIPTEILTKPTKLSKLEFSLIKEHSQIGYEMLKHVESPWPLAQIVHQHHERIDGSGYPNKLSGNEIIIEARIMAVADVVEAMASHRPYRASLGIESALEEIKKNKGIIFDDAVVDACLRLFLEKGYQLAEC